MARQNVHSVCLQAPELCGQNDKAHAPVISQVSYENRPIYTVLKRIIFRSSKSFLNSGLKRNDTSRSHR